MIKDKYPIKIKGYYYSSAGDGKVEPFSWKFEQFEFKIYLLL